VKKIHFIILLLIIAAGISFIAYSFYREKTRVHYILQVNKESRQNIDSSSIAEDSLTAKQKALLYTDSTEEEIIYNYYIITGSFSNQKNAQRQFNHLKTKGYKPKIIRSDFEHFKVSVFSSYDKEEALDSLAQLKSQEEFNAAWLLKKRK